MWDYIYKCNEIFNFRISCLPNILVSWFRTWNSGCLMDVRSRLYVRFSFTLKLYDCILSFHGKHTKWKCFTYGIKMIIIDILLVSSIIIIFYNNFDVGNLTEQAHCRVERNVWLSQSLKLSCYVFLWILYMYVLCVLDALARHIYHGNSWLQWTPNTKNALSPHNIHLSSSSSTESAVISETSNGLVTCQESYQQAEHNCIKPCCMCRWKSLRFLLACFHIEHILTELGPNW